VGSPSWRYAPGNGGIVGKSPSSGAAADAVRLPPSSGLMLLLPPPVALLAEPGEEAAAWGCGVALHTTQTGHMREQCQQSIQHHEIE